MFYVPNQNPFIHSRYDLPLFSQPLHYRNPHDFSNYRSNSFSFCASTTYSPLNFNPLPLNPFYIRLGLFDRPLAQPFFINRIPVHHHANCPLRQDAQKTHVQATEVISPHLAELVGRIGKTNNVLEDLLEYLEKHSNKLEEFPDLFEAGKQLIKEAAHLRKQAPTAQESDSVSAYETAAGSLDKELRLQFADLHMQAIDRKKAAPQLPKEPCLAPAPIEAPALVLPSDEEALTIKKNFALTMSHIDTAYQAFTGSYTELEQKIGSLAEYSDVLAVRKKFWEQQQAKAFETNDFDALNTETKEQEILDFYLIVLLEHQVNQVTKLNTNLQSHLGILSSLNDHEAFAAKIRKAASEINHPIPSDAELTEIKKNIALVLIHAEKHANAAFLNTLSTFENEFAEDGYTSVAAHYTATIREFQTIIEKGITQENVDTYIAEWNALLKEFDLQHQFLLKLKDAEKALKDCSNKFGEWILKTYSEGKKDPSATLKEIDALGTFIDRKASLIDSPEIDAFIKKIYAFIKTTETKIR